MAVRYHVSPDGKARKCQAKTPEACKAKATIAALRGQHFETREDAEKAYEKVNEEKKFKRLQRQKKKDEEAREEIETQKRIREIEEAKRAKEDRVEPFVKRISQIAENSKITYESFVEEYSEKNSNKRLEELQGEKNALVEDFKNSLNKNVRGAEIGRFYKSKRRVPRVGYGFGSSYITYDKSPSYEEIDIIADRIYALEQKQMESILKEKNNKLGLMDKVFTNREEERDELLVNGAVDYLKHVYDPNDSPVVKEAMKLQEDYYVRRSSNSSLSNNFIKNFVKHDEIFDEEIVVLKASDSNFPVKDQKDYVHFKNIDFSHYPDHHREVSEIHEKLSNIKRKMHRYDQMLKETGEKADPEIVQSARMTVKIGNQKASKIISFVKEQEKTRKETEAFYNDSNSHGNKELDEFELDLFHEVKSASF